MRYKTEAQQQKVYRRLINKTSGRKHHLFMTMLHVQERFKAPTLISMNKQP